MKAASNPIAGTLIEVAKADPHVADASDGLLDTRNHTLPE
jgi:hypothetical protein